jgi:nucleoid-associated protein YgaU
MKILVCNNGVVVSKSDTNLTDAADVGLIKVGDCTVHLVNDDDMHAEGDAYDPKAEAEAAAKAQAEAEAAAKAQAEAEAAAKAQAEAEAAAKAQAEAEAAAKAQAEAEAAAHTLGTV